MNKTELITAVAEASGVAKKDAERVLNAAIDKITQELARGGRVQLSGFGIFETKNRQAKVGRNPVTREPVQIPVTRVPVFKSSQNLKKIVEK
jgi:DNA-binding protein HU-beta